jgi:hypothetical protein
MLVTAEKIMKRPVLEFSTYQPIAVMCKIRIMNVNMYMHLAQDVTNTSHSETKSARHGTDEE